MKTNRFPIVLTLCLAGSLAACASRAERIVLLPDPDGRTGTVTVATKGGTETLSEGGQATDVRSPAKAPTAPAAVPEAEIRRVFGEALDAQPPVPAHYVLYFLSSATELAPESRATLDELVAAIERIKPAEVAIVGHTDRRGKQADNHRLGLERARIIKKIIMAEGVAEDLIEIVSHGEDNPLVKTEDEVPEPKNRRVEVVIR